MFVRASSGEQHLLKDRERGKFGEKKLEATMRVQ
jgi:hypothetical protein